MRQNLLPNIVFSVVLILLLSGCFAEQRLAFEQKTKYRELNLPFEVSEIEIIDERPDVSEGPMRLPFFTFPNMYRKQSPVLTAEHRTIIEETVRNGFGNRNSKVKVVVTIQEAYKEFSIVNKEQEERSAAQFRIDVFETTGLQRKLSATWHDRFFIQSWDAKHRRSEEIYKLVLRKTTYGCLQRIEEQVPD